MAAVAARGVTAGRRRCLAGLALVALAGCAGPQALIPTGASAGRSLSRTGRFVVNVREPNVEPQVVQGGFAWLDHGGQLTLDLTSPLGAALARLQVQANGSAVLTDANGNQTRADTADALMARVVGVDVPVAGLRDWLAGTQTPGVPVQVLATTDDGRASHFRQAGWDVRVLAADPVGPLRLSLQRTQGVLDIEVRLALQAVPHP